MRITAFILALGIAGKALSDEAQTRDRTLDQDLQGPAIDWTAEILQRFDDGSDACFLLRRTLSSQGYAVAGPEIFITCHAGSFEGTAFAPRNEVRVRGNLGSALPRRYGEQVLNLPYLAAPYITPSPTRTLLPPGTVIVPAYPAAWPYYPSYGAWPYPPAHPVPWRSWP